MKRRCMSVLLCLAMLLSLLPTTAFAEETDLDATATAVEESYADALPEPDTNDAVLYETASDTDAASAVVEDAPVSDAPGAEDPIPLADPDPVVDIVRSADASVVASGSCATDLSWSLDSDGILTISGTGTMPDYSADGLKAPWDDHAADISYVVIEDGVPYIGSYAFTGCALTGITIPDSVDTGAAGIFYHCTNLVSVALPRSFTLSPYLFSGCTSLTSVTFPSASAGTGISDNAFSGCTSLKSFVIPDGIHTISNLAFAGCSSLTSVTFPSSLQKLGATAFADCTSLESVTLPEGLLSIGNSAFAGCSKLKSLQIPASVTAIGSAIVNSTEVVQIRYVGCESLWSQITLQAADRAALEQNIKYACLCKDEIDISDLHSDHPYSSETQTEWKFGFDAGSGYDDIVFTFDSRTQLEVNYDDFLYIYDENDELYGKFINNQLAGATLRVPGNSVTLRLTTDVDTEAWGFAITNAYGSRHSWNAGTTVTAAYGTTSGLRKYTCRTCQGILEEVIPAPYVIYDTYTFDSNTLYWGITADGRLDVWGCARIPDFNSSSNGYISRTNAPWGTYWSQITEINLDDNITVIGVNGFSGLSAATEIHLPSALKQINSDAFSYCTSLREISIPSSCTSLGMNAFMGCSSLRSATFGPSLSGIGYVFNNCHLNKVNFLGTLLDWINMFSISNGSLGIDTNYDLYLDGVLLTDLIIPAEVTVIPAWTFGRIKSITSVTFHDQVTSINADAFYGCTNLTLTRAKLPSQLVSIGISAFQQCSSLTAVSFPSSLISLGSSAFYYCSSLSSVTFAEDISLTVLPQQLFYGCPLTSIQIPESVTTIEDSAFYDTHIKEMIFPASVKSIGASTLSESPVTAIISGTPDTIANSPNPPFGWNATVYFREHPPANPSQITCEHIYYPICDPLWTEDMRNTLNSDGAVWTGYHPTDDSTAVVVPATCTDNGTTTRTCTLCQEAVVEETSALGHDYQLTAHQDATCIAEGSDTYTCTRCGDSYSDPIPINTYSGHTPNSNTTVVPPTCTESGYTYYICSQCSQEVRSDYTMSTGHSYEETSVVAPNCWRQGYTINTCSACGSSYHSNYTAMTSHSYTETVVVPTCTSAGYTLHICTYCGSTYQDNAREMLEHDMDAVVKAPTCTQAGYTTHTCNSCSYSFRSDFTAPTGHNYVEASIEAGCVTEGYTQYNCSECGYSYTAKWIPAAGHKYFATVTPATCTERGYTTFACSECDASYQAYWTPATGHNYTIETTAPTCTTAGYSTFTCSVCGDCYTDHTTPAYGHRYRIIVTEPTCTESGYTTYTCIDGDHSYVTDATEAVGHNWNYGVVTAAATYAAAGTREYTCTSCGLTRTEEIPALTRTALTDCSVYLAYTSTVYTGLAKTPAVTVLNGRKVVPASEYTVAYSNHTDAGTATVTITAKDGNTSISGACESTFTIQKARQAITARVEHDIIHIGRTEQIFVAGVGTINCTTENNDVITLTADGAVTAASAGTALVTVSVAGDTNYRTASVQLYVVVEDHCYDAGSVLQAPSTTQDGTIKFTCLECEDTIIETIPMLAEPEHRWQADSATPATCSQSGTITYVCADCGQVKAETLDKEPSNHRNQTVVGAVAAACGSNGYSGDTYCADCNELLAQGQVLPALSHVYTNYLPNTAATYIADKTEIALCDRCGHENIRTVANTRLQKTDLADCDVTLVSNSVIYDGTGHIPAVSLLCCGIEISDAYYTVSIRDADGNAAEEPIQAGDYQVLVSAKNGNIPYCGYVELPFNILKATPVITASASYSKILGTDAFNLNAAVNHDVNLTYTSSDSAVAAVDETGLVTLIGVGTAVITINCAATGNTEPVSKTVSIKVSLPTPTLSSVTNVNGGVKFTWKAVSGAELYRVYRKTATGSWTKLADVTATSYTDKTAVSGTTYSYSVRCMNAAGTSATSAYNTTGLSVKYIAAPTLSSATNVVGGVKFTWKSVSGAELYRVYRKTASGSWTKLADVTTTSYTDKTAVSGTTYYYSVRCMNAAGTSAAGAYNTTGLKVKYIAAPSLSTPAKVSTGIKLKWTASAGAELYRVYRKTASGSWVKLADVTTTTYTDKTAKAGTTYSYTVRCFNAAGTVATSSYNTTGKSIVG